MKRKPRKYQSKLTLYPMTFEQIVNTVLVYKPKKTKAKKAKTK
jgi:hypothetical protein